MIVERACEAGFFRSDAASDTSHAADWICFDK
jgi:hypothetical protein